MLLVIAFGGLLQTGCSPAGYEVVKPSEETKANGNPTPIAPETENPNENVKNMPPTAAVEVIFDGRAVTQVLVNKPVLIQPTASTVDPDDIGVSSCRNPGIVEADYKIGELSKEESRAETCDSLSVAHTFTQTGEYTITMDVLSNESESASASMVIQVVNTLDANAGFTIVANPMLAGTNQEIKFYGYCVTLTKNFIKWEFGDAIEATGTETGHQYTQSGQYQVGSTCTDQNNREMKAWVTVVVVDSTIDIPGVPVIPVPPFPSGPDDIKPFDPTCGCQQKPGQQPWQQGL